MRCARAVVDGCRPGFLAALLVAVTSGAVALMVWLGASYVGSDGSASFTPRSLSSASLVAFSSQDLGDPPVTSSPSSSASPSLSMPAVEGSGAGDTASLDGSDEVLLAPDETSERDAKIFSIAYAVLFGVGVLVVVAVAVAVDRFSSPPSFEGRRR